MRVPNIGSMVVVRVAVAGAVALLLAASTGRALGGQEKKPPPPPKPPAARPANRGGGGKAGGGQAGGPKQVPAEQLEKMLNMTPEERQKAISKLPPQQQKQLQTRLDNLDRMSPEQRQQQLERARQLEALPPERRQAVTRQIQSMNGLSIADQRQLLNSPDFGKNFSPGEQQILRERFPAAASTVVKPTDKLVPARRQAVNQETQRIGAMPFAQRREALHSPEFTQQFSPEEQQMIRDKFPGAAK